MNKTLEKILNNEGGNHILPLFWLHGEDDAVIINELHKVYDCGIRSVCVESRPDPDFGREPWYEDLELILAECKKLGMDMWMFDDSHFPTGKVNGLLEERYPHLSRRLLTERHIDVSGPARECGVIVDRYIEEGDRLVGIVARKRYPDCAEQRMTSDAIDITDNYDKESGVVFFDVPEGFWRVFIIIDKPFRNGYIDMLREDSVRVLIDGVYEPHVRRFREYAGTFRGFFSDEPFLMHSVRMLTGNETYPCGDFPWNSFVGEDLDSLHGRSRLTELPGLWFPADDASGIRVDYMETVTLRFEKCFSRQIGDWCRAHGVEYIGHVIEDHNLHTGFSGGGHFFRSLAGQDMAGIDVVLDQIVPGMSHNPHRFVNGLIESDFFHFGLAKLGSSHAHIQPLKKGRALCEIFGAFGWAEGTKMMKWLTDHMLVNGINEFAPHAFSPKYPDPDCPPHFYAQGNNPLYRPFGVLMRYMNRVADLLSGGTHIAPAALFYHAQAEWSGRKFMRFQTPGAVLTENQIDYDVIPEDYLGSAEVSDGALCLNGEKYRVFVVPYSEALPCDVIRKFAEFSENGLPVLFVDGLPEFTTEGERIDGDLLSTCKMAPLCDLPGYIRESGLDDVYFEGTNGSHLRTYHYLKDGLHIIFATNEGIRESVEGCLKVRTFGGGKFVRYDPMENAALTDTTAGGIGLQLEPYGSAVIIFGDVGDTDTLREYRAAAPVTREREVTKWSISFAGPRDFDPEDPDFSVFESEENDSGLYNIIRRHRLFCGFVKYEAIVPLSDEGKYILDLGEVGECAWVWADGTPAGCRIAPPYRFEINGRGMTAVRVVTASHRGYTERDRFSATLGLERTGLLGPVTIGPEETYERIQK